MERYTFVADRSRVWIRARSTLHPIESESSGVEGFFEVETGPGGRLDLTVPPKARIEMPISRLSSGNPLYDREMRRRVDERRFPTIDGELVVMEETAVAGCYAVTGSVTFRGVTREYRDQVTVEWSGGDEVTLAGEHTFDVRDFGLQPPRIMMLRVEPDVAVRVQLSGRRGV